VKTAISVYLHSPQATQQEKDLMKNVADDEMIQQIIGNAKVHTPGLYNHKNKEKSKKQSQDEEK
jgi:hypothetical protein